MAGNLFYRMKLVPDGVTFKAVQVDGTKNFCTSDDLWFRPVNFVNAPDGCLHICDMYREVIEHPWSIPDDIHAAVDLLRGRDRGRIWRLTPRGSVVPPSGGSGRPAKAGTTIPGALEGEALKVLSKTGGNSRPQGMGNFGAAWSGGSQLWWTGAKQGDKLTLSLSVKEKGRYALTAALTKAKDYGIIDVSLDGKPVVTGWDGYDPNVIHSGTLDWGTHTLDAGEHQLVITISGTNANALPRFMVGVDYVKLEKK